MFRRAVLASVLAVLGIVGGPALDTAVVELIVDGELTRQRELDFDGAGMLVASLPSSSLEGAGTVRVRVRAPDLGLLELDPISESSAHSTSAPASAPPAQPGPPLLPTTVTAPAQLPARVGVRPPFAPLALPR